MNTRKTTLHRWGHFALTPLALALAWTSAAHGAEYWLCAKSTSVIMPGNPGNPNNVSVPMWGYAGGTTSDGITSLAAACASAASVPGPALVVPPGDTTLTVNLRNDIPDMPTGPETDPPTSTPVPVSIVISGQSMPTDANGTLLAPVKFSDSQSRQRVRSFTAEAAPGGGTQSYTWTNLKPGTYLYHSGTHPQVQVQMGLYGAVKHDAASGQAYASVPYASEVTLLFSEIDPDLHADVVGGYYGPGENVTSTIDYAPLYFLINGKVHTDSSPMNFPAGNAGQTTLLRLLNAGLQTRSPVLQGTHMRLIAEDGKPYSYAREQYSVFLPALKTVDAVITPASAATYPIYDRRLAVTNPGPTGSADGGMLAMLEVAGAPAGIPVAVADSYSTAEDLALSVPLNGVLDNDSGATSAVLASNVSHGSLTLNADGSFTYTPANNYNGADSFSYRASNGSLTSAPATVSLSVTPANDPPVAANNAYSVVSGATLNVAAPGVLGNDSDVDGDALTAVNASVLAGLSLSPNGSFVYNAPATAGSYSFTYQARDPTLETSAAATVTFTVIANRAPVAANDTAAAPVRRSTPPYTPVSINVLANDTDPDGNLYPATVTIVTPPNKGGSVSVVGNGTSSVTVSYTPRLNYRGSENFRYRVQDSAGALSNIATVKVNVK